jgi:hypothetical protein
MQAEVAALDTSETSPSDMSDTRLAIKKFLSSFKID